MCLLIVLLSYLDLLNVLTHGASELLLLNDFVSRITVLCTAPYLVEAESKENGESFQGVPWRS